jgi:hypothetical protein
MSNPNEHDSSEPVSMEERKVQFGRVDYSKTNQMRFYANHVAANVTMFELRLILSDVDVVDDGLAAVQTVTVLMSPELAKLTHFVLGKSLDNYIKRFGGTRLPDSALQTLKTEPPDIDSHES